MSEVDSYLEMWSKSSASEAGRRVASLLDSWVGLHHLEHTLMRKADWSHPFMVAVKFRQDLATFDGDLLTSLVILAHDHCIRVSICPGGTQYVELRFHPRALREGSCSRRHPTLEDMILQLKRDRFTCVPAESEAANA